MRVSLLFSILVVSLIGLLALAWFIEGPRPIRSSDSRLLPAEEFDVPRGSSATSPAGLRLSFREGEDRIILRNTQFPVDAASTYAVTVSMAQLPAGVDAAFFWRKADAKRVQALRFSPKASGTKILVMQNLPDWSGEVTEIGLMLRGRADKSINFTGIALESPSFALKLHSELPSLFSSPNSWSQQSINHLKASTTASGESLTVVAGLWLGLMILLVSVSFILPRAHAAAGGALLAGFSVIWLTLDLRWQLVLEHNLSQAKELYKGKSWEVKASTGLKPHDGLLYRFASHLKTNVLPDDPQRIFLVVGSKKDDGTHLRLRYHLLPHNVNFTVYTHKTLPTRRLREGDYLLLLGTSKDIVFEPAQARLRVADKPDIEVEIAQQAPFAILYQVTKDVRKRRRK